MSNAYFQFKQFRIEQDRCAMKVSTDACIQGAWTPIPAGITTVLDVGAGTGLLSLMIAQRNPQAIVTGLELDAAAANEAAQNVRESPFADRVTINMQDARMFQPSQRYDLLICNPPFFQKSLHGPDKARNLARHNEQLGHSHIIALMEHSLAANGAASIMLPVSEMEQFEAMALQHGWQVSARLSIKDTDNSRVYRKVCIFGRMQQQERSEILVIKNPDQSYTERFRELLSAFYLHL